MTREERENAIRCMKMWIEREPQIQTYKTCLESLKQEPLTDVLNEIRTDVEHIEVSGRIDEHSAFIRSGEHIKHMVIDIIDKYKADKENEE